ncbi:hypothetical protein Scep_018687 [Stephania cephalantha]|uniref:Alliinase n=1 Tax=Stephania cephalantha TaxID=152367 RepID=A0AAP0I9R6_9MAGN
MQLMMVSALLIISIALNTYLIFNNCGTNTISTANQLYYYGSSSSSSRSRDGGGEVNHISWSRAAAEEAEAATMIWCSGHGRAYLDGLSIHAQLGNPLFLEPYWMNHAATTAVVVSGWNRMGYAYEDDSNISKELEKIIRQFRAVVGNANTSGKYILFGAGSTQLLNAAIIGLSPPHPDRDHSFSPASVVASAPFYQVYKQQTDIYNSLNFKWQGDTSTWKNKSDQVGNFIEFVTSPNNPDADSDLMIFTMSKLTGHAGSRFGWAFVKDEAVYKRMSSYLSINSIGASQDAQLRAFVVLRMVVKDKAKGLFEFGYKTMRERWEMLNKTLSKSKRFSLQKLEPRDCSFFKEVTAYAWLKCEREEDHDCYAVLRAARIISRKGSVFSVEDRYARLSLIKNQDEFDLLLHRIDELVSQEEQPGLKTI